MLIFQQLVEILHEILQNC